MLDVRREVQLRQDRHYGLLQPVARRAAGAKDLDDQAALVLCNRLSQWLSCIPAEKPVYTPPGPELGI